jgi:hypothetical protein
VEIADWLAERNEFELSVPVSKLSDDSFQGTFATERGPGRLESSVRKIVRSAERRYSLRITSAGWKKYQCRLSIEMDFVTTLISEFFAGAASTSKFRFTVA